MSKTEREPEVEAHAAVVPQASPRLEDPLAVEPEEMRRLGYEVVDMLVERFSRLAQQPAVLHATRAEMEARLRQPPPERRERFEDILAQLRQDVLPYASRSDHPRFFAFVPTSPTWPSVLGDLLATGFNVYQGAWLESAGPSQVELIVVDWFKEWLGLPETAGGLLLSGGSASNMTALACASDALLGNERRREGVIYLSSHVHSSVIRATRVLGFPHDQIRVLPVDDSHRLRVDALAAAVEEDAAAGRTPFFVVANAGTTNTGAIDPLNEIAELCAERRLWLHVDAAYGGFAVLTERGSRALAGIERADSLTLDPHKWLYQPYEAGCCIVRDRARLLHSFHILPDYLRDAEVAGDREVNFSDLGIQLTRGFRALKIWVSLKYFGVDAFRGAIERCLDLVQAAEEHVRAAAELELLSPASLGVLCFRRHPDGIDDELELEALNASLIARLAASGEGMVSSTRLDGRYAIRLCVLNHTSTHDDVTRVLRFIETADPDDVVLAHGPGAAALQRLAHYERHVDVGSILGVG